MPNPEASPCRICGNPEGNSTFQAREMMFGTREAFTYLECSACGTVQILEVPGDLARHYPADYYSLAKARLNQGPVKSWLRRHRARHYLGLPSLLGRLAAHKVSRRPKIILLLRKAGATPETPVLDVGCGTGGHLVELYNYGFRDLTGVDPFLEADIEYTPTFRVLKAGLEDVDRRFPIIMMNHALEHMADPLPVLRKAGTLLTEGGTLMVRVPLAGTYAHRHYQLDWVQLDPPRHLVLLTERAMAILAQAAGLRVRAVSYDSEAFQFWGSEQYRRDIPLKAANSYGVDPGKSIFQPGEIEAFAREAVRLNEAKDGDQACFFLEVLPG